MTLNIDLDKLKKVGLTPSWFAFLMCIYHNKKYPCANKGVQAKYAKKLEELGWCKVGPDKVVLREKFLEFISNNNQPSTVGEWIEDWRNLWPKGVKSGGRSVKGDKRGCLEKMKKFVKLNPGITREQIFEATKMYIFERERGGYNKMICADYFIEKDKASVLGGLIEDLEGKESFLSKTEREGGSNFHKEI